MTIDEDYQAWERYPHYRWIFNKLDLALRLGYAAAPACVPFSLSMKQVIIRPIYNLYGMGVGAKSYHCNPEIDNESIITHGIIPPGYFWCEYFTGDHVSIDYKRKLIWVPFNAILATQQDPKHLTKFGKWTRIEIPNIVIPEFLNIFLNDVENLNIEFIGDKIIEIHLRTGNDILHDEPIGTQVIPLWQDIMASSVSDPRNVERRAQITKLEKEKWKFIPNHHAAPSKYAADGHLSYIRLGYMKK